MLHFVSFISNETKERGSEWLEWSKCSVSKMNGLVFGSAGYKNVMYEGKILSCYVWCNCAIHTGLIEQQCETRSPTDDFTTSCFPSVLPHVCLPLSPVISTLCCCLSVIPLSEKHFRILITDWNKKKKKGGSKAGQRGAAGISNDVYVCVWDMCAYLWVRPFCSYEVTSLQPQTTIDNWFHVPVLSGSLFGSKPLTACPECHGRKPTGSDRSCETHNTENRVRLSVRPGEALQCEVLSTNHSDSASS